MGKSLGEDLMAEVLGGAIPVQHRHLPDPATKFTSFCRGQPLNHWPRPTLEGLNSNFDHGRSGRAQQGLVVKWEWHVPEYVPTWPQQHLTITVTTSPTPLPEAMPLAPQALFHRASFK